MTLEEATFLLSAEKSDATSDHKYYVGILFDYLQDETSSVEASITDNYVESNYSLQDHIAVKPRVYRLRGCVGEVLFVNTYKSLNKYEDFKGKHPVFKKTIDAINNIGALSGIVSNYTQAAMNITKQIESSYDRYKQIIDNFRNQTNEYKGKRQKVCYDILSNMLKNRVPVTIENLAFDSEEFQANSYPKLYFLQSVSAHQGDNAYISDIEVTIKEFRIATTQTTQIDTKKFGGYVASQTVQEANNGLAKGNTVAPETAQKAIQVTQEDKARANTDTIKGLPPKNPIKRFYLKLQENTAQYNSQIEKSRSLGYIK